MLSYAMRFTSRPADGNEPASCNGQLRLSALLPAEVEHQTEE
jgi:hypothetical protein